jgi:hypothetical protein
MTKTNIGSTFDSAYAVCETKLAAEGWIENKFATFQETQA